MNLESLESVKKSADLAEDARLVGALRGAREIPAVWTGFGQGNMDFLKLVKKKMKKSKYRHKI